MKIWLFSFCLLVLGNSCQLELPSTSLISIEFDNLTIPVNQDLYGLTIEEINHAIDGGLYAELIQNRSFEDGTPPFNCPYDPVGKVLITPNGWSIPFMRPDSLPGWRPFSSFSFLYPDTKELINEKNRHSLLVSITASTETGKGGVIAEGYNGIPLSKGEKYNLSFYIKGASMMPKTISVMLMDSLGERALSEVYQISTVYDWKKYKHTFTAADHAEKAILAFTTDTSAIFWLDVVSLLPEQTWKGRQNGLRPELMELIAGLNPKFIRFPGGSFVEGYTAGTYPIWHETVGNIAERKHFWNIWSYGTTNGVGYHEYLQMCEDLNAEPIYVINSGVTSQSRRPRYEDITAMGKLVQDALDAIAYANQPADSTFGAMRAKHGHPEPFHLKYIEIGSENYGQEYTKRFELFKKAINETYPEVTVISSSYIKGKSRNEWADTHFYSSEPFLMSNYNRYTTDKYSRRLPSVFIGEFSLVERALSGSLQAAIGEACFLIGVENGQDVVKRLAYAPILGNSNYMINRNPAILYNGKKTVLSPSYHMLQIFWNNRGDEALKTEVKTYLKPQISCGRVGIEVFDNSYEIRDANINNRLIFTGTVMSGEWQLDKGLLIPAANRWNCLLTGDTIGYNYTFSANIRRTKGSGHIQFRVRDNGLRGEQNDYIGMTIGLGTCDFYRQAGGVKDSLSAPVEFALQNNQWYSVKIACKDSRISCYVDDKLIQDVELLPIPSIVSAAAWDKKNQQIILKVVNTTQHEEKTELNIKGVSIHNTVEITQLAGKSDARNTFDKPDLIVPETKEFSFTLGSNKIYHFPPNSITVMKLKID